MQNILLLTWTIQPNDWNVHKSTITSNHNPGFREKEYLWTILYYITRSNFDKFVFCENSWYEIKSRKNVEEIARTFWKEIELLQYKGDGDKIKKYSYAYWEAEILDYAFKHSKFIKESNEFFKVTWRYVILNINDLINEYKDKDYFFYKWVGLWWTLTTHTAFFMTLKDFYKKNLFQKVCKYFENLDLSKPIPPLEWIYYHLLKNILFKDNQKITKYPIYHFFTKKIYYIEIMKNKLWLHWYGIVWKIIDKVIPFIRKYIFKNF